MGTLTRRWQPDTDRGILSMMGTGKGSLWNLQKLSRAAHVKDPTLYRLCSLLSTVGCSVASYTGNDCAPIMDSAPVM